MERPLCCHGMTSRIPQMACEVSILNEELSSARWTKAIPDSGESQATTLCLAMNEPAAEYSPSVWLVVLDNDELVHKITRGFPAGICEPAVA